MFAGLPRTAALACVALATGCAAAAPPADPDPGTQRGAALALVIADNRTADTLTVAFRPAAGAGNEVIIGRVPPGERRQLAPVPAAEPIILSARVRGAERFQAGPRSFVVDERWVWILE